MFQIFEKCFVSRCRTIVSVCFWFLFSSRRIENHWTVTVRYASHPSRLLVTPSLSPISWAEKKEKKSCYSNHVFGKKEFSYWKKRNINRLWKTTFCFHEVPAELRNWFITCLFCILILNQFKTCFAKNSNVDRSKSVTYSWVYFEIKRWVTTFFRFDLRTFKHVCRLRFFQCI